MKQLDGVFTSITEYGSLMNSITVQYRVVSSVALHNSSTQHSTGEQSTEERSTEERGRELQRRPQHNTVAWYSIVHFSVSQHDIARSISHFVIHFSNCLQVVVVVVFLSLN